MEKVDKLGEQAYEEKKTEHTFQWDAFICHASEDKDAFVRPLANELKRRGLRIWYDEFTLRIGDSLRRSVDKGLAKCRYGIIILSPAFFAKEWPQKELDGLVVRERLSQGIILPVWLNVSVEDVAKYSLPLADRVAAKASEGFERVVDKLLDILRPDSLEPDDASKTTINYKTRKKGQGLSRSTMSSTIPTIQVELERSDQICWICGKRNAKEICSDCQRMTCREHYEVEEGGRCTLCAIKNLRELRRSRQQLINRIWKEYDDTVRIRREAEAEQFYEEYEEASSVADDFLAQAERRQREVEKISNSLDRLTRKYTRGRSGESYYLDTE
jgi:hypothetical protein